MTCWQHGFRLLPNHSHYVLEPSHVNALAKTIREKIRQEATLAVQRKLEPKSFHQRPERSAASGRDGKGQARDRPDRWPRHRKMVNGLY